MAEVYAEFEADQERLLEIQSQALSESTPLLPGASKDRRPWYRRPSPGMLIAGICLWPLAFSACIGPKLELYARMICYSLHRPDDSWNRTMPVLTVVSPWLPNWLAAGTLDPDTCRSDPEVQRRVAALTTGMTIVMGVLSAIFTSYWASLSSRKGRTRTMAAVMCGVAFNDVVFLATVYFIDQLTYRFLLLGPLVEGLVGGFAGLNALSSAYIADCTEPGSRAKTFSMLGGTVFAGIAVGPTLGGLLINATGNLIAPFYFSLAALLFSIFCFLFLVPESLPRARQEEARLEHEKSRKEWREMERRSWKDQLRNRLSFLQPILLLLPAKRPASPVLHSDWRARWALPFVGLAYALHSAIFGIYSVKMLYAQFKFSFGPVEIGYLLTVVGLSRVTFLILLLPLAIKLVRKKRVKSAVAEADMDDVQRAAHARVVLRDSHFDLRLARISVLIEALSYFALIFTHSPIYFVVCTVLTSFGGGSAPAIQSLALSLAPPKDSAKILAALSVVNSIFGSALGPLVFGVLWVETLNSFAEAIFVVGFAVYAVCTICLLLVGLRKLDRRPSAP